MLRAILVTLFVATLLSATGQAPDAKDVPRLVRQLGAEKFDERETASKSLEAIGSPALDALRQAAKGDDDAEVRLRAGRLVKIISKNLAAASAARVFTGHDDQVTYAVFSADGKHILSASDDQSVRLWDVASGK